MFILTTSSIEVASLQETMKEKKKKKAVLRDESVFGKSERMLLNTWSHPDPSSSLFNSMTMAMFFNFTEPIFF